LVTFFEFLRSTVKMVLRKTYYSLLVCFLLSVTAIYSQLKFNRISNENGLSNNSVNCILEDSRGFMWFGTFDGLNKYDGYKFTYFKPDINDTNSISDYNIRCIYEDHLGFIWIGTDNGLNKYDPYANQFKVYAYKPNTRGSISHKQIVSIFQDQSATMWFGTGDAKLNKLDKLKDVFVSYSFPTKAVIRSIVQDNISEQTLLYLGSQGVYSFNPSTGAIVQLFSTYGLQKITDISINSLVDYKEKLYIGSWRGFFIYDKTIKTIVFSSTNKPGLLKNNIIQSLLLDQDGKLWLGTRGGGLYRMNTIDFSAEHFVKQSFDLNSLSDDAINTIYQSRSGILWFGTTLGGVSKLSLQYGINKFSHFLPGYIVTSIYDDEQGNIWVGTRYKGLLRLNSAGEIIRQYNLFFPSAAELSSNTAMSVISSPDCSNCLLIATETDGIMKLNINNGAIQQFSYRPVNMMVRDFRTGNIWASTWGGGIFIFSPSGTQINHLTKSSLEASIPSDIVSVLYQTQDGVFWAGSKGFGLTRIESSVEGSFAYTNYRHKKNDSSSISSDDVFCIYQDSNQILWVGTTGGGLNRFDERTKKFRSYSVRNGLPSNLIYYITEDNSHNLWFSTSNGLVKFNTKIEKLTVYDTEDGLQDNQFISGSGFRSNSGRLYFGGINGLNTFYSDSIRGSTNRSVPPLAITDFKVLKKGSESFIKARQRLIYYYRRIVLPYQYNDFSIEFAALDYTYPMRNRYGYKLKGYDNDWIFVDAEHRTVRYTNLKPGEYEFLIQGTNNDNIWNESGANLTIIIKPPFWLKTWFISLNLLIILIILILIFIRIRRRNLERRKQYEDSARESLFNKENQLRTLVDNLPDFIYIKDVNSRFILANKRLSRVMIGKGHTADELVGKTDHDYYEKKLADRFYADEQNIIRSGEPLIGRIEPGLDENGEQRIINTTKVPVKNSKGEVIGLVGIGRDITEIKRAEQKIQEQAEHLQQTNTLLEERQEQIWQQKVEIEQQKEELEKLNITKDKLFSIIGHDLKNPFHAIIGLADALSKNRDSISSEETMEIIGMMKSSSQYAYELLENLLQWSRAQTGKMQVTPQQIDLKNIIDDTLQLVAVSAEKKNIRLDNRCKVPVILMADINMLTTVIRNLLGNAIKFTPEGGTVTISAGFVNDMLQLEVSDTGVGMTRETVTSLFKLDRHRSSPGTMGETGTGLGLLICKEFIELHKGRIEVESIPGKGSTFKVFLPK